MAPRRLNGSTSSQSQPSRRRQQEEPESSESSDEGNRRDYEEEEEARTQGGNKSGLKQDEIKRKGAQLAKMALLFEYKRNGLRKGDMQKQIIPGNPQAFPSILQAAQSLLRAKFGMELVELRTRQKGDNPETNGIQATQTAATQAGTQGATGQKRRLDDIEEEGEDQGEAEPVPTAAVKKKKGVYILRSILPTVIIDAMSIPNPLPMFGANGRRRDEDEEPDDSGSLLQWEKADGSVSGSLGMLGVRTVVLCLVLCMGRVVQDDHLHAFLRRLNLHRDTVLPFSSKDSNESPITLDKYLDVLARQNYLEKVKVPHTGGMAEGMGVEWRWGSREAEFSERAAAMWIQKVMIDSREEEFEAENAPRRGGLERRTAAKARDRLHVDVAKAAGGPLAGGD